MRKIKLIFAIGLPVILVIFGLGVYLGSRLFSRTHAPRAKAAVILSTLHDRGFLVTQTYVFDQPIKIEKKTGSAFKDIFWGETITARGAVEVNLGIDLGKVSAEDIEVAADSVKVKIPGAQLFNSRLLGPMELNNERGLLKRLIASDQGYNEALSYLTKEAEASALQAEFIDRADERAKEDIARLLGYVALAKKIIIEKK